MTDMSPGEPGLHGYDAEREVERLRAEVEAMRGCVELLRERHLRDWTQESKDVLARLDAARRKP